MTTTTVAVAGNERLRGAMVTANVTIEGLAVRLGMDVKSVERWLTTDRTPHARNAHAAARILGADPYHLWPDLDGRHRSKPTPRDELVTCYPTRGTVPYELWGRTLTGATGMIDLAASHLLFWADAVSNLPALLADRIAAGVRVRVAVPDSGVGGLVTVQDVFPSLTTLPGVRLVRHGGICGDIIRADDDLLICTPIDGTSPALSPVLHLRRLGTAPLTSAYLTGLDHIFGTATPWRPLHAVGVAA